MTPLTRDILDIFVKRINKPDRTADTLALSITQKTFAGYDRATQAERDQVKKEIDQLVYETNFVEAIYSDKGFETTPVLKKIVITDGSALLNYLSVESKVIKVQKAIVLLSVHNHSASYIKGIATECADLWRAGKTCYGCSSTSANNMVDALTFLEWLNTQGSDLSIDQRTASVRALGDSKRLENIIGIVANLLRGTLPVEAQEFSPFEVLSYFGVHRYAPSFRFKASVLINGSADVSALKPFVEIPPEGIDQIEPIAAPSYILFIENKTTFERYTREIDDDGWVFYTNGFPSRTWQQLYREFIDSLGVATLDTSVYHWGDIDPGGYKILAFMCKAVCARLIPYRMNPEQSDVNVNGCPISVLKDIIEACHGTYISDLHESISIARYPNGYNRHEQEFDPIIAPNYDTDLRINND